MFVSTSLFGLRRSARAAALIGMGLALTTATTRPTYADEGGALAAGIIGGTAAGLLAFGAAADAYGPPPPPPYGVESIEEGPPPPCHEVLVESFDPYAQAYVETPRRVCDGY